MNVNLRKFTLLFTACLLLCGLGSPGAFGQPPSLINFRGQLLDNGGQPVTASVAVELRIFSAATGGTELYLEDIGYIEVRGGQYAFQFGANGNPDLATVIQGNAEAWVEVTVDNNALPRQRFVSVPYALNAGSAQIASGAITRDQLSQQVRDDINRTITKSMLSQEVLTEINQSSGRRSEKYDYIRLNIDPSSTEQTQRVVPAITPPNSAGISGTEVILFDYLELQEGEAAHVVTVPEDAVNLLLLINGTEVLPYWTREYDSSAMTWEDSPKKNSIVGPGNLYAAFLMGVGWVSTTPEKSSITLAVDRIGYNQHEYVKLIADPNDEPYVYAEEEYDNPAGSRKFYRFGNGVTLNDGDTAQVVGVSGRGLNLLLDTGTALFSHPAVTYDYSTTTPRTFSPNFTNLIIGGGQLYAAEETDPGETIEEAVRSIDLKIIRASQAGDSSGNGGATTVIENGTITREMLDADLRNDLNFSAFQSAQSLSSLYMPYGYDGEPVVGGNEYTVPVGKVLAIIDAGFNPNGVSGNSEILLQHENTYFWVSRPGEIVLVDQNKSLGIGVRNNGVFYPASNRGFVGLLFDSDDYITPVHSTSSNFVVPSGKKLVITSNLGWIEVDSISISSDDILRDSPIVVGGETTLSLRSNDGRHGFSGYLIDENRSLGGGFISSTDQESSVTPSMLSDSILKYLRPEIVQEPSFTGAILNGTRVELNPGVEGKYVTYQWYKDGDPIDGATSQLFTIDNFDVGYHDGNYTVVASNDFGSVESQPIELVEGGTILTVDLNSTVSLEMIWVEPGTFTMGSPTSEAGRSTNETQHEVTLTQGFYLGKYEVTQAQYEAVMAGVSGDLNATPSNWPNNPDRPVEKVSWEDIQVFLTRLNAQQAGNIPEGWAYVLPTEAQWEYACRAGTTTTYSWGDTITSENANYGQQVGQPSTVGNYAANPWGFFDMHGNVWEWTADAYASYATGAQTDPFNVGTTGSTRVLRGGTWSNLDASLRSACRLFVSPSFRFSIIGFRVGFQQVPADVASPEMQILGDANITQLQGVAWVDPGVEAHDVRDGNLSGDVTVSGTVDVNTVGTYTLTYTVSDAAGNQASLTRTVNVGTPATYASDLNASVALEMIWVEPGTFTMGQDGVATPVHEVTLTQGFYLGKYEVTQAQYQAVMTGNTETDFNGDVISATPSNWPNNPNRPVEKVSWKDIQVFLAHLNEQQAGNMPQGWAYVLPTEAQWEYACRAGTTTAYSWGDTISASDANWDHGADANQTENVGQYSANPWGFFDMHGNVYEWTADADASYATGAQTDPFNAGTSDSGRVIRGGSWTGAGAGLRSAYRGNPDTYSRSSNVGFRVGFQQQ